MCSFSIILSETDTSSFVKQNLFRINSAVGTPALLLLFLTGGTMSAGPATLRILIKGGKVVNDDFTQEADVYIENGIIQQVGKELMIPGGAKVIDATGKLVLPGGIDTSVHLQESFMNVTTADDFYSGTKVPCVELVPCIYVQLCNDTQWSVKWGSIAGRGGGKIFSTYVTYQNGRFLLFHYSYSLFLY